MVSLMSVWSPAQNMVQNRAQSGWKTSRLFIRVQGIAQFFHLSDMSVYLF
jgi:hypothetical protein